MPDQVSGLYRVRPISDRTQFHGKPGPNPQLLGRTPWHKTLREMARELDAVGADDVVLEVDVSERQIRADGELRSDASVRDTSPAVRLAFTARMGPLSYATDMFGWDYYGKPLSQGWQQNVRAIVLGMESLRRVERYGIAQHGEQYRGYLQIEGRVDNTAGLDPKVALQILTTESGWPQAAVEQDPKAAAKIARRNAHPDHADNHGDDSRWMAVHRAMQALGIG